MMSETLLTGLATAGGLITVAQIPASGDGLLELALKTGTVGIVAAICIVLIREHRKTIEGIVRTHSERNDKSEAMVERLVKLQSEIVSKSDAIIEKNTDAVRMLVAHCSAVNGEAKK
jgi:hypothetical protein